jgi:hypothetical protein
VTRGSREALQGLSELPCAKSGPPIGAASKAIRGYNLGTRVPISLVAVLLLVVGLVFVVRAADRDNPRPYRNTRDGPGRRRWVGPHARSLHQTPRRSRSRYLNNHAGTPSGSEAGAGGSSLDRDPAIERHAEIVAHHNGGDLRRCKEDRHELWQDPELEDSSSGLRRAAADLR